jgi:hypothetical protein
MAQPHLQRVNGPRLKAAVTGEDGEGEKSMAG